MLQGIGGEPALTVAGKNGAKLTCGDDPLANPDDQKLAARILTMRRCMEFSLDRAGHLLKQDGDIDVTDLMIGLTVWSSNTRRIHQDLAALYQYCFEAGAIPEARLEPVSRSVVSRFLNIPFETTRRRIEALLERGILESQAEGLICRDPATLFTADFGQFQQRWTGRLARLHTGLAADGIALAPAAWIATRDGRPVDECRPEWVPAVMRLSIERFLIIVSESLRVFDIGIGPLSLLEHRIVM